MRSLRFPRVLISWNRGSWSMSLRITSRYLSGRGKTPVETRGPGGQRQGVEPMLPGESTTGWNPPRATHQELRAKALVSRQEAWGSRMEEQTRILHLRCEAELNL